MKRLFTSAVETALTKTISFKNLLIILLLIMVASFVFTSKGCNPTFNNTTNNYYNCTFHS